MTLPLVGTLLVSCPDQPGIVAALSRLLFEAGANILDADQHSDTGAGQFFQRIRFQFLEEHVSEDELERRVAALANHFAMTYRLSFVRNRKRVAVFVSRYEHCLVDLLWRHRARELDCDIALVVSNHPDLGHVAKQFGIDYRVLPVGPNEKAAVEDEQHLLLETHRVDLVVLARYMQVLSAEFVDRYPSRIINIHHSFLPAFSGSRPYRRAYDRGVKLIGATAHYATSELDEGPIIEQDVARTSHRDSVEDMIRKGRDIERAVLARAVRWHLEDRVWVYANKTVVFV